VVSFQKKDQEVKIQQYLRNKLNFVVSVFFLVLSRLPKPECNDQEDIKAALAHCNIPFDALVEVDQDNCHEVC
jgi:hypothetical protein